MPEIAEDQVESVYANGETSCPRRAKGEARVDEKLHDPVSTAIEIPVSRSGRCSARRTDVVMLKEEKGVEWTVEARLESSSSRVWYLVPVRFRAFTSRLRGP